MNPILKNNYEKARECQNGLVLIIAIGNMMPDKHLRTLLVKYLTKQASQEEMAKLLERLEDPRDLSTFHTYIRINYAIDYHMNQYNAEKTKKELIQQIRRDKRLLGRRRMGTVLKYAAVVALAFGLGYVYHSTDTKGETPIMGPTVVNNQIETGTDKATLTLENGEQITLAKGQEYQTNNASSNGEALTYRERTSNDIAYNQLTIPRGGQYQIKLSDGTKVWLNSETQLRYPVAFAAGQDREVELLYGEAYFDVSPSTQHNGAKFKVVQDQQSIEVLGTEFNINAYKGEQNIYTTLVEGSIALEAPNTTNERTLLTPGQQANLDTANQTVSLGPVEVYDQVSWKEGVFSFERKSLRDIMKVLSRWYDMEVVFADRELETIPFTGSYNKDRAIEDILETIQNTGFINSYRIHNKTVTLE